MFEEDNEIILLLLKKQRKQELTNTSQTVTQRDPIPAAVWLQLESLSSRRRSVGPFS